MLKFIVTRSAALLFLCSLSVSAFALADGAVRRSINIPAENLATALDQLSKQSGSDLVYRPEQVRGFATKGLVGEFTAEEAVTKLLKGTSLTFSTDSSGAFLIATPLSAAAVAAGQSQANTQDNSQEAGKNSSQDFRVAQMDQNSAGPQVAKGDDQTSEKKKREEQLSEVVVTGTHIQGVSPTGSSVKLYTRDDIEQSGAATLDQFARQMTENFSTADAVANFNSTAAFGKFSSGTTDNVFAGSAFDLHGLGTTATLTLLNGHRLAPAGSNGLITDISQIPLSAIDHIEVLTDGASAVYGADAVAGVVNIVTRKDFDGAETSLRYGTATSGGDASYTASQLLGTTWGSGNAILTYEFNKQNGLDASRRDYIPSQGGPYSLLPENKTNSVLATGQQQLFSRASVSVELLYSHRDLAAAATTSSPPMQYLVNSGTGGNVTQTGANLGLDVDLFRDWRANIVGNYSKVEQLANQTTSGSYMAVPFDQTEAIETTTDIAEIQGVASGTVLTLPGGAIKAAFGSNFRTERFDQNTETSSGGVITPGGVPSSQRHVASAFVEVSVPVIGEKNRQPWADRLEISLAGRYDHYDDFGGTTNPRYGILWTPVNGLNLRGSYGTSFHAPALSQLNGQVFAATTPFPDPAYPGGVIDLLAVSGSNPSLTPETSRSVSAGFDVKPLIVPGFVLSATYFNVNYHNRIETPQGAEGVTSVSQPGLGPFFQFNPPLALVESYFRSPGFQDYGPGPAGVQAIFYGQFANIATTKQSGVDLSTSYSFDTRVGKFDASLAGTRLIQNEIQTVAGVAITPLLNTFAEPTAWKVHTGVGWTMSGLQARLQANYVNAYSNTQLTPAERIASWTTVDFYSSYKTESSAIPYLPSNLTIVFGVQNLANKQPPYAAGLASLPGQNLIPFDAANASPVGRYIFLQLTKRWGR